MEVPWGEDFETFSVKFGSGPLFLVFLEGLEPRSEKNRDILGKGLISDYLDPPKQANGSRMSAKYKKSPSWLPEQFWDPFGVHSGKVWAPVWTPSVSFN